MSITGSSGAIPESDGLWRHCQRGHGPAARHSLPRFNSSTKAPACDQKISSTSRWCCPHSMLGDASGCVRRLGSRHLAMFGWTRCRCRVRHDSRCAKVTRPRPVRHATACARIRLAQVRRARIRRSDATPPSQVPDLQLPTNAPSTTGRGNSAGVGLDAGRARAVARRSGAPTARHQPTPATRGLPAGRPARRR